MKDDLRSIAALNMALITSVEESHQALVALFKQGELTHAKLMAQLTPGEGTRYEALIAQGYGRAEALAMLED